MTLQQYQSLIDRLDKLESDIRSCATKIATVREEIFQQMSMLPMMSDPDDIIGSAPTARTLKEENRAAQAFVKRFYFLYQTHRSGARYHILSRHFALIKPLLAEYGPERLEKLALVLLKTDEEWIEGTDRGIGILSTKASWLDERLSRYEAAHGPIKVSG